MSHFPAKSFSCSCSLFDCVWRCQQRCCKPELAAMMAVRYYCGKFRPSSKQGYPYRLKIQVQLILMTWYLPAFFCLLILQVVRGAQWKIKKCIHAISYSVSRSNTSADCTLLMQSSTTLYNTSLVSVRTQIAIETVCKSSEILLA